MPDWLALLRYYFMATPANRRAIVDLAFLIYDMPNDQPYVIEQMVVDTDGLLGGCVRPAKPEEVA